MALRLLQQVRTALTNLNPKEVEASANRSVHVLLRASTEEIYQQMEDLFATPDGRIAAQIHLYREGESSQVPDLELTDLGLEAGSKSVPFDPVQPARSIAEIVNRFDEIALALARRCPTFRPAVVNHAIWAVSRENALFSVATAMPNVVPILSLPLSVGEFASDTAFLTMNQIRMGFLIAAAYGRPIGYNIQKGEIAGVITGAFGWRALARTLVSKIPFGGGVIPKAAISFAGTYLAGRALERLYQTGRKMGVEEQKQTYKKAYESGATVVRQLLQTSK